uniref:Flavinbinding monooxygenaselike protein putative n=1 Tax=Albugo laibachii Nc14 TaxID=890382 RepID=F0W130_9STRA|nr:flavinbinding monooxygenaselike protein putative [Albugo laibachii Nc14]|eukprot:CCA14754.1 flavinbinding monooxygenaselike protein putative [Albugo laibachii Nc14]
MSPSKRVGIVGAGAAGLVVAKILRAAQFDVTVFEKSSTLGGLWNYSDNTHTDATLYESLHTNLPTPVMQLSDFPFGKDVPSFPSHRQMLEYLREYAAFFKISDVIQSGCLVERIESETADNSSPIRIQWKKQNETIAETFDKVVICNGHFAKPAYPTIEGMQYFEGSHLHSHDYRRPESFENKRILLIGMGPSGDDISKELVNSGAKEVIVSYPGHIEPRGSVQNSSQTSEKRILKPPIRHIDQEKTFVFQDGTQCTSPDVIIYCTGYQYTVTNFFQEGILFPDIGAANGFTLSMRASPQFGALMEEAKHRTIVAPLYEHLLSIQNANIAFVGLTSKVLPFLCFELQAKWLVAVYKGDLNLPSKSEMIQQLWNQVMQSDSAMRKLHTLGALQRAYLRKLATQSNASLNEAVFDMYEDCASLRKSHPFDFRKAQYQCDVDQKTWTRHLPL